VTDRGQELMDYFMDGQIQEIAYSVGLSYGLQKFLYYFDGGELVYVYEEEDDYPATNEGLDYEKTEPVFSGEYFFQRGKLVMTKSEGTLKYQESTPPDFVAMADELHKLLHPNFSAVGELSRVGEMSDWSFDNSQSRKSTECNGLNRLQTTEEQNMPEDITHKIRLSLSEYAEEGGEALDDDFYVMVSIGSEGVEVPVCTLRELLMEKAESSGSLENEQLPPLIARFRGVAKHADDAAMDVHHVHANWEDEEDRDTARS